MLNFIMDDQFSNEKDLVKEALESVSPTNIRFGIIGCGVSSLRLIRKLGIRVCVRNLDLRVQSVL